MCTQVASPTDRKREANPQAVLPRGEMCSPGLALCIRYSHPPGTGTSDTVAMLSSLSPQTPLCHRHFDFSLENIFRSLIMNKNVPALRPNALLFSKAVSLSHAPLCSPSQQRLPSRAPTLETMSALAGVSCGNIFYRLLSNCMPYSSIYPLLI